MNDIMKKDEEHRIVRSLVRDFIIYIDQECFKSPELFNPFVDAVVPTLRKYNKQLNVNCGYIKSVRKILSNEKNLKNNLKIIKDSGRLIIQDYKTIDDLVNEHAHDSKVLVITQEPEVALRLKEHEYLFDANHLFIKQISNSAEMDYLEGIRNKYANLGNSVLAAAEMDTIIVDLSSLFYEMMSFFLEDLNNLNNPRYKYKIYVCKGELDRFESSAKVSHFADLSYSRLDREFGVITFNPQYEGKDDEATIRKFRTENNIGVLTFNDSRATEFYNMNDVDLSGRLVCPFRFDNGDANAEYPSSPWRNDMRSLFNKVVDILESNQDSFEKYKQIAKEQKVEDTSANQKTDDSANVSDNKTKEAPTSPVKKAPLAEPVIKVNNSEVDDLVIESEATKNNDMLFTKATDMDFSKTVVQPKSVYSSSITTASSDASVITPTASLMSQPVIKDAAKAQVSAADIEKSKSADATVKEESPADIKPASVEPVVTDEKKDTVSDKAESAKSDLTGPFKEKVLDFSEMFPTDKAVSKAETVVETVSVSKGTSPAAASSPASVKEEPKTDDKLAEPAAQPAAPVSENKEEVKAAKPKSNEASIESILGIANAKKEASGNEAKKNAGDGGKKVVSLTSSFSGFNFSKKEQEKRQKQKQNAQLAKEKETAVAEQAKAVDVPKTEAVKTEETPKPVEHAKPSEQVNHAAEDEPKKKHGIFSKFKENPFAKLLNTPISIPKIHRGGDTGATEDKKADIDAEASGTSNLKEQVKPVENKQEKATVTTPEVKREEKVETVAPEAKKDEKIETVAPEAKKEEKVENAAPEAKKEEKVETAAPEAKKEEKTTGKSLDSNDSKSLDAVNSALLSSIAPKTGADPIVEKQTQHEDKKISFKSAGVGFSFSGKKTSAATDKKVESVVAKNESVPSAKSTENKGMTLKEMVAAKSNGVAMSKDAQKSVSDTKTVSSVDNSVKAAGTSENRIRDLSHAAVETAMTGSVNKYHEAMENTVVKNITSHDTKNVKPTMTLKEAVKVHSDRFVGVGSAGESQQGVAEKKAVSEKSMDDNIAENGNIKNFFQTQEIAKNIISNNASKSDATKSADDEAPSVVEGDKNQYGGAVADLARKTQVENAVKFASSSSLAEKAEEMKNSLEKTIELKAEVISKSSLAGKAVSEGGEEKVKVEPQVEKTSAVSSTEFKQVQAEAGTESKINPSKTDVKEEKKESSLLDSITSSDKADDADADQQLSMKTKSLVDNLKPNVHHVSKEEYANKGKALLSSVISSINQNKSDDSSLSDDIMPGQPAEPVKQKLKPSATGFNLSSEDLVRINKQRAEEKKAREEAEAKQRAEDIALGKIKVAHAPQKFKLDKSADSFSVNDAKAAELRERHRINDIAKAAAAKYEQNRRSQEKQDLERDVNTVKAIEEFELEGRNGDFVFDYTGSNKSKDDTPVEEFEMTEKRREMLRNYETSKRPEVAVKRNLDSANFFNANDHRKNKYGNATNSSNQIPRKVSNVTGFDSSLFSDKPKTTVAQKTNPERSTQDYARVDKMIEERTRELEARKVDETVNRTDTVSVQSQTVDIVVTSQDGHKIGEEKTKATEMVAPVASKVESAPEVTAVEGVKSPEVTEVNKLTPFPRTGVPFQSTIGLGIVAIPKIGEVVFVNGQKVTLDKPIIMSQSLAIYANGNDTESIIKIFGRDSLNASMIVKLETMMENQVRVPGIEWPRALVKNESGDIVGCVMRNVNTTSLQTMCNSRDYYFHNYNRADIIKQALDYLNMVKNLHELNIYLGVEDMNSIAVASDKSVSFINLEKMQIGDYPYLPNLNAVTAPELAGEDTTRMADEVSDRFVVASTLFKFLFLGRSPFVSSSLQGVPVDKLLAFRFPENVLDPMVPPKDEAYFIWSYLPDNVKEAFIASLSNGYHDYERRKTVDDWIKLLNKFKDELQSPDVAPMALELFPSRMAVGDPSTCVECKLCRTSVPKTDAAITGGFCHHCFNQRGRLSKCACCGKTFLVSYRDIKVSKGDSSQLCQSCKNKFMHTRTIGTCHECNRSYVITEGDELMYKDAIYTKCQDCIRREKAAKPKTDKPAEKSSIISS